MGRTSSSSSHVVATTDSAAAYRTHPPGRPQKLAATALWYGAKLEEVPEVSEHPRALLDKAMVAIDRCIARREAPEGRKLSVLDTHSKVWRYFVRAAVTVNALVPLEQCTTAVLVPHCRAHLCNRKRKNLRARSYDTKLKCSRPLDSLRMSSTRTSCC